MLFDNVTKHNVTLPAKTDEKKATNFGYLVKYIMDNLVKDPRKELFVQDGAMCVEFDLLDVAERHVD